MSDLPTAQADPGDAQTLHDDIDDSAMSALNNNASIADDGTEHAGLILQNPDGKYTYTAPVTSRQHDHFALRAALQKGWNIAGIYHTHLGSDADAQLFSPDDLAMASKLGVPSYIRFMKDGAIRKYTPGHTQTERMPSVGSRFDMTVSQGDPLPDATTLRANIKALRAKAAQQLSSEPLP